VTEKARTTQSAMARHTPGSGPRSHQEFLRRRETARAAGIAAFNDCSGPRGSAERKRRSVASGSGERAQGNLRHQRRNFSPPIRTQQRK